MPQVLHSQRAFPLKPFEKSFFHKVGYQIGQIINNSKPVNPWHFLWVSVLFSEILTAIMNTVMGILWWGKISYDLLLIGTVDAFVVSLIVASIVIYFVKYVTELASSNEYLHREIAKGRALKETLENIRSGLEQQMEERAVSLKAANEQLTREISERQQTEEMLRRSERFFNTIFDSIHDPFCIFDRKFRITKVNEAYARMKNRTVKELSERICYEALEDKRSICDTCVVEKTFQSLNPCAKEKRVTLPDGSEVWVEIYTYPIIDAEGRASHVIEYSRDITDRKKVEEEKKQLIEELEYLSRTDSLTSLLNRRALIEKLEYEMNRAKRYGSELSLILCDIDNFKEINDTCGHHVGDRALQMLSETLMESVRKADIVGRYGGDEFMFILPETPLDGAENLAEKIRLSVEKTEFRPIEEKTTKISLSLGVTCFDAAKDDIDAMIKRSDSAIYVSKQAGKNKVYALRP